MRVVKLGVVIGMLEFSGAGCNPGPGAARSAIAPSCSGQAVLRNQADLAALCTCPTFRGDVIVTGGQIESISAHAPACVHTITGTLHVGPTLRLGSVHLDALRHVGALEIDANLDADGVFLPVLERVSGSIVVSSNTAVTGLSAPLLTEVGGSFVIHDNPSLVNIDASRLRMIGGSLEITTNLVLELLELPVLERVRDKVWIHDNPALPLEAMEPLERVSK